MVNALNNNIHCGCFLLNVRFSYWVEQFMHFLLINMTLCFSVSKCLYLWFDWLHRSSRHEGAFKMIFLLISVYTSFKNKWMLTHVSCILVYLGVLFLFRAIKVSKVNQVNQVGKVIRWKSSLVWFFCSFLGQWGTRVTYVCVWSERVTLWFTKWCLIKTLVWLIWCTAPLLFN